MSDQHPSPGTSGWPIGAQARPWLQSWGAEDFAARLGDVMAQIATIGFAGFETALKVLPLDEPEAFLEKAAAAGGIVLCGAHAGGRWWDPSAAETVGSLAAQAARLPALGCNRIEVSMQAAPHALTDEQLQVMAENLTRLGQACRAAGDVRVAFHNHASELADDARVIAAIVERCDPVDVQLGTDLGWVAHAGIDLIEFVERFGSRLAYLHVRDVTSTGEFVEMGRGVLNYRGIFDALEAVGYHGWLVAESELSPIWRGSTDPDETAAAQIQGLRDLLGSRLGGATAG